MARKKKKGGGRKVAKKRRSTRVKTVTRRVTRVARSPIVKNVLAGVGAFSLTAAFLKRLGVDLGGMEGMVPFASAYLTGGWEGALASMIIAGLPTQSAGATRQVEAV